MLKYKSQYTCLFFYGKGHGNEERYSVHLQQLSPQSPRPRHLEPNQAAIITKHKSASLSQLALEICAQSYTAHQ